MAEPTFSHDMTIINNADTTTSWVAVGGAMLASDSDNKIQGTASVGVPGSVSTVTGGMYNIGATVNLSGQHLFIWALCAQPGIPVSFAEGGVRVRVAGSTSTNYGEWFVGGNDVLWVSDGKFRLVLGDTAPAPA